MNKLLDGIESKREAIVTGRPDAIEADLPAALEQAVAGRLRRAADDDVVHRIWHRDGTLWAPEGTPEVTDRLGWLDIPEKMLDCVDDLEGFAARGARRRLHRRRAVRHGRLEPRARGVPPLVAEPDDDAARARLDAPRRRQGDARRDRPRQDAVRHLLQVGRDDRDAVAVQVLPRAPERRRALRRGHRPGHVAGRARPRARLPARVRERPRHRRPLLGAVVLRARAGGADRRRHPRGARDRRGGGHQLPAQGGQLRACGSGSRSASWPATGATSSPSWSTSRCPRSASGSSSSSPSRPASTAAASCRSPTSRSSIRTPTGRTACSCTSPSATRATRPRSPRCARPATRRSPCAPRAPADLGRLFFHSEFATAVAGWVLELNPFDQPNVQEAKDNTAKALAEGPQDVDPGSLDELLAGLEPPRYVAILALPALQRRDRRGGRALPREADHRARRGHHVRLRPALPALDRPVPQGRPADAACSSRSSTAPQNLQVPGRVVHLRHPDPSPGRRRPATLRAHGLPAVRVGKEIL